MRLFSAASLIGLCAQAAAQTAPPPTDPVRPPAPHPPGPVEPPAASPSSARDGEVSANKASAGRAGGKPASAAHALRMRLGEARFDGAPLAIVLDSIRSQAGINMVVRWNRLGEVGVERDAPISLSVRNLRLEQLLWLVLEQAGGKDARLAFRADHDLLLITTAAEFEQEMIVRIYDVRDLTASRLRNPTLVVAREHDIVASVVPTVAAGAVGVAPVIQRFRSGVIFEGEDAGGDEYQDLDGSEDRARDPERFLKQLVDVVTNTIEPEAWNVNGGPCSITAWRGQLVVRATPMIHQKIGGAVWSDESP